VDDQTVGRYENSVGGRGISLGIGRLGMVQYLREVMDFGDVMSWLKLRYFGIIECIAISDSCYFTFFDSFDRLEK